MYINNLQSVYDTLPDQVYFLDSCVKKMNMSKSNVTRALKLFPMVLYTYTKTTNYQITKKNYSSTDKHSLYKKEIRCILIVSP